MPRPTILLKRSLIFVHRWLGVALSVIFMMWFASGIVMMYWSFPGVSGSDRAERAPRLDPEQIMLSPDEAYATLNREQPPTQVRLTSFDGRPVYQFSGGGGGGRGGRAGGGGRGGGGGQTMVYADDGTQQTEVNPAMFDRVAAAWAKLPIENATKESMEAVDQWTVAGQLRTLRPLYKYTFNDGQQVYVSGRNADVVQYTTSESRFWAYLGAIPHWVYFTTFRQYQPQWFSFIVWTSGIGTGLAILGMIIAIWMYSPRKKYRYGGEPTSIPYSGQKRWHTILGLFFGVITVTWAFSGLLSMGPFEFVDRITGTGRAAQGGGGNAKAKAAPKGAEGQASATATDGQAKDGQTKAKGNRGKGGAGGGGGRGVNIANALRGNARFDMAAYADKDPREALGSLGPFEAKELEWTTFAGEPIYMATNGSGETRIIPIHGDPIKEFDSEQIISMLREAGGSNLAELRMMNQYDAYYLDRLRERPLPVVYVRMNDENETRYYFDPKTARTVGNYSSRNWVNRWLYHGLHSLDFPWLYNNRPLWDIVVITLMLGGTALCVTSLILTWRVLKRKFAAAMHARATSVSDDLELEKVSS